MAFQYAFERVQGMPLGEHEEILAVVVEADIFRLEISLADIPEVMKGIAVKPAGGDQTGAYLHIGLDTCFHLFGQ